MLINNEKLKEIILQVAKEQFKGANLDAARPWQLSKTALERWEHGLQMMKTFLVHGDSSPKV